MADRAALLEALRWQAEAGADEAIGETPVDRYAATPAAPRPASAVAAPPPPPPAPPPAAPALLAPASQAEADARAIAASVATLEELRAAVEAFEGCALKKTAMNTV